MTNLKQNPIVISALALCLAFGLTARSAEPTLDFTGNASYIDVGNPDALQIPSDQPLTIEVWVRFDAFKTVDMLYCKNNPARGGTYTYMFGTGSGKTMRAYTGSAWRDIALESMLDYNHWYHLAYSFDGTTLSYYLDGELAGTAAFNFGNDPDHTVTLGGYTDASDINGNLSDVRVWNYARTELDIQTFMNRRLTGAETGLQGYWRLNEGAGTNVFDTTANASTGTIINATWVSDGELPLQAAPDAFVYSTSFTLADIETGNTRITNSNEVELVAFPIPEDYDEFQFTDEDGDVTAIDPNGWRSTNDIPPRVSFSQPAHDTNVTLYAWFTNTTVTSEPLLRAEGAIVYATQVLPVASAHSELTRGFVEGGPLVVLTAEEIDNGSTGGTFGDTELALVGWSLDCSEDSTPEADEVTLDALGQYEVILTVTNEIGNTASAASTIHVVSPGTNTYYVDIDNVGNSASPYTSWATAATNIQDAVYEAEAGSDTESGVFSEVVVDDGVYVVTNQLVITKPIRLYSNSGDPATTAISGSYPAHEHRVMHVTGDAWIRGFTISNGYAAGEAPENYGGGVFMTTNGPGKAGMLTDCHVIQNQARLAASGSYAYGSGIYLNRGGTVSNCLIQANTSDKAWGGGVFCNYGGRIENCTIIDNSCSTAAVTQGGGIALNYGGFVTNCFFARNVVRPGRGMGVTFNYGGEVVDCTFTEHNGPAIYYLNSGGRASYCIITNNLNGANYYHDGILEHSLVHNNNGYGVLASRTSQIYNCIVSGNNGRGLTGDSRMIVRNTLVYGNVSDADGGGVRGATLENVTVVRNQATQGGGVSTIGANSKNLIVYDNLATVESNNCFNAGNITYSCTTPLIPGEGNIDDEPLFRNPGSGYGPGLAAGDWRLRASSPCRNRGLYDSWMEGAVDVRGLPRILPEEDGIVDMGAYENTPVPMGTLFIVH